MMMMMVGVLLLELLLLLLLQMLEVVSMLVVPTGVVEAIAKARAIRGVVAKTVHGD